MQNTGKEIKADYMQSARYTPQIEVDEKLWGCHLDWYRDEISKPSRKDPFWKDSFWGWLNDVPGRMKIPVFIGEGWYDTHLKNALKTFSNLSKEARAHSVFQVMPGGHQLTPVIYGQKKQEHAAISEHEQQIRWFYDILVREKLPEPSVSYYMIGADEWRTYQDIPSVPDCCKRFYLNGGTLTTTVGEDTCREYDYDPKNPVPSHGGATLFATHEEAGSVKQPEPDWRDDVLSYITEPLNEDMDIVGPVSIKLWVESSAEDTCFAVKLMEVYPDGETYNIRNGITTLGYRNDVDERVKYEGGPIEIEINTWDIAWQVKRGLKLRLDVSSSNFPEYSIHPNTARDWALEAEPVTARQKILTGRSYPSCMILPIINKTRKEERNVKRTL